MGRILIVGSGGREHTLAFFLGQSRDVEEVYIAPGNAGSALCGANIAIDATGGGNFSSLADFAHGESIDLTVVGPEVPLCSGLVDYFKERGLRAFGPGSKAARLEGDKVFARRFMERYNIPQPAFAVFDQWSEAESYLQSLNERRIVVKAAGLAAGKGAIVCDNLTQALEAAENILKTRVFGSAGDQVVIEEFLEGEEASVFAICDGRNALYLAPAQDHKRIFDGDKGPNTGGMGAYAPAPLVTAAVLNRVDREIIRPLLEAMALEGTPYQGCLYAGLMIKGGEAKVVEFNCRFGDPETQAVLPLLDEDLYQLLAAAAAGELESYSPELRLKQKKGAACCVVMASGGYPGAYEKGRIISGLPGLTGTTDSRGLYFFHSGTGNDDCGRTVTAGGRVLGITGTGSTIAAAIDRAYQGVARIDFEQSYFRKDIGFRAVKTI
ncbi:MAG: phosphoribosylamine--glycine ligase [Spirochaeta sp.]|nr:phosphoribosylamine--glycine ligase [Spirochaeta sp.]